MVYQGIKADPAGRQDQVGASPRNSGGRGDTVGGRAVKGEDQRNTKTKRRDPRDNRRGGFVAMDDIGSDNAQKPAKPGGTPQRRQDASSNRPARPGNIIHWQGLEKAVAPGIGPGTRFTGQPDRVAPVPQPRGQVQHMPLNAATAGKIRTKLDDTHRKDTFSISPCAGGPAMSGQDPTI